MMMMIIYDILYVECFREATLKKLLRFSFDSIQGHGAGADHMALCLDFSTGMQEEI